MHSKKLLVLGANGLLGTQLLSSNIFESHLVTGHYGRNVEDDADLSVLNQSINYLDKISPDVIINLVALTNVDYCEKHVNESYLINVKVVENIVSWVHRQDKKVHLVQISTDQVYDGKGPHKEDLSELKNYYAFSKYAGELAASTINASILRTNFFGKSKTAQRSSFTDWLYNALESQQSTHVFDDVYFSPLSMNTLLEMIRLVVETDTRGVYNLGSKNGLSKADFAFEFAKALGMNNKNLTRTEVEKVNFIQTYRPKDMRLEVSKFEQAMGVLLPDLKQEIIKVSKEYL